ncbi:hypothetical protein GKZ68_09630 [Hymenobacter sp. BRD128]|uniref:hypothetical protein n=1 Tax=Hymenobacter sp. BRD128 TaxID=2675878 RepID=UPI0015661104|nr:hypothetical protein [Hymenobacter sp. BRD128]QKG55163.1 hypothetical protein GKZ68_09630 [Hymenobacter sp. BRD128]
MTLASILHELEKLPLADRIFVVEQASASIEAEKARGIRSAVDILFEDYRTDHDLAALTQLDEEAFVETAPETAMHDKIMTGLHLAYERMLEFKRQKNSEVVVMRDGKIAWIKP